MMLETRDDLDPALYDNRKGCSTTHYIALLIHFVLSEAEAERCVNLPAVDYFNALTNGHHDCQETPICTWTSVLNSYPGLQIYSSVANNVKLTSGQLSDWEPQGTRIKPVVFLGMVGEVAVEYRTAGSIF